MPERLRRQQDGSTCRRRPACSPPTATRSRPAPDGSRWSCGPPPTDSRHDSSYAERSHACWLPPEAGDRRSGRGHRAARGRPRDGGPAARRDERDSACSPAGARAPRRAACACVRPPRRSGPAAGVGRTSARGESSLATMRAVVRRQRSAEEEPAGPPSAQAMSISRPGEPFDVLAVLDRVAAVGGHLVDARRRSRWCRVPRRGREIVSSPPWPATLSLPAPGVIVVVAVPAVELVVAGVAVHPVVAAGAVERGPLRSRRSGGRRPRSPNRQSSPPRPLSTSRPVVPTSTSSPGVPTVNGVVPGSVQVRGARRRRRRRRRGAVEVAATHWTVTATVAIEPPLSV